jgi:hypothetical protein
MSPPLSILLVPHNRDCLYACYAGNHVQIGPGVNRKISNVKSGYNETIRPERLLSMAVVNYFRIRK